MRSDTHNDGDIPSTAARGLVTASEMIPVTVFVADWRRRLLVAQRQKKIKKKLSKADRVASVLYVHFFSL